MANCVLAVSFPSRSFPTLAKVKSCGFSAPFFDMVAPWTFLKNDRPGRYLDWWFLPLFLVYKLSVHRYCQRSRLGGRDLRACAQVMEDGYQTLRTTRTSAQSGKMAQSLFVLIS